MSTFKYITGGVVLAVLVASGVTASWPRRHRDAPPVVDDSASSERLLRLEQEVAELRASQARLRDAPLPARPEPILATSGPLAATTPSATAPRQITVEERRTALEARFFGEHRDAQWSKKSQDSIERGIAANVQASTHVTSVECRESLCVVSATHESIMSFRTFSTQTLGGTPELAWSGPMRSMVVRREADGSVVSETYLGRDHDSLDVQ
jgi:hypothetical protein